MLLSSLLVSLYVFCLFFVTTTDSQITLPTRAYSLKRTGGPKPAAEEPTDEKLANGDDDTPDSPVTATLGDDTLRGRRPISGSAGRDASTPSDRTIVESNAERSKPPS